MRTGGLKGGLLLTLVIALLITPLLILSSSLVHAALTPHDPIYIEGNDNFTPANGVTSGSGTAEDPYIIEGWDINTGSYAKGIEIRKTTAYFIIRNCYVHGERDVTTGNYGIFFRSGVRNGTIKNNLVANNRYGIYLWSSSSLISNNLVENTMIGIMLWSGNNFFSNNIVRNSSQAGFYLSISGNNLVENNLVENNSYYGINLGSDSDNNLIFHNNFVKNDNQVFDNSINFWDNGSEGNYWSDYTGMDADGDGIGDTPHSISGDNNQDRYPSMNPFVLVLPEDVLVPPEEAPSMGWLLIAGIVGVIVIVGIAFVFYVRRH